MKRKYTVKMHEKQVEREYSYIPLRYILAVLITVFEVLAVLGTVAALCYYVPYFYILAWLTEIGCVIKIITSDDNPDYKVPWLLFVLIVPIAGFMLYFMFYSRTLQKRFVKRLDDLKNQAYRKDDTELMQELLKNNSTAAAQAKMLCNISESHLFLNTKQRYFPLGEDMFATLLEDLKKAEHFIFMEYFIIE
ncbi:MAG: PLDc N-terminal domain-containing protein, partial [Oscillospiraceae bacterium]|nr:PLDc N-terminal domain-containing protein [Oscillospiraceae bacterium]